VAYLSEDQTIHILDRDMLSLLFSLIGIKYSYSQVSTVTLCMHTCACVYTAVSLWVAVIYRARPISLAHWKLELGHREIPTQLASIEQEKCV